MANYYTIITNIGKAKMANAQVLGRKLDLKYVAIGDGQANPKETQTVLQNEVWRGQISAMDIDPNNPNWIVVEAIIPSDVGGFTVREVGLVDVDGDLIAVGKYPETYKPELSEGSAKDLYLRTVIEVTNAESVQLKIDPAVVIASRKYVDDKIIPVEEGVQVNSNKIDILTDDVAENKQDLAAHLADDVNPHNVTKSQIGLSNVDNVRQIPYSEKGQPNGVAVLGVDGKLKAEQVAHHSPEPGNNAIYYKSHEDVTYQHEGTVYRSVLELQVNVSGIYRVKYGLRATNDTAAAEAFAQIYKNGQVIGSERRVSRSAYVYFTEDLPFSKGDSIQFFIKRGTGYSTTAMIKDITISGKGYVE